MTEIACVECGKGFQQKLGLRQMKFCSAICRSRKHKREAYHRDKTDKFQPKDAPCDMCGKTFRMKKRNERYCSKDCYAKGWHFHNKERVNARGRKRRREKRAWYRDNEPRYNETRRSKVYASAPWRFSFHGRKSAAKKLGLPFDLTDEWGAPRWTGRCELTGFPFTFGGKKRQGPLPTSITVDRIIPSLGYVQDNCRFVLHCVNAMKSDGTETSMFEVAEALISRRQAANIEGVLSLPG